MISADLELRRVLHELANHLGRVVGYAELLEMTPDLTPEQRALLQSLLDGAAEASQALAEARRLTRGD